MKKLILSVIITAIYFGLGSWVESVAESTADFYYIFLPYAALLWMSKTGLRYAPYLGFAIMCGCLYLILSLLQSNNKVEKKRINLLK